MKASWQFIISPFLFSMLGLMIAWAIASLAPSPNPYPPHFEQAMLIILPVGGIVVGIFLAYLATPFTTEMQTTIELVAAPIDLAGCHRH